MNIKKVKGEETVPLVFSLRKTSVTLDDAWEMKKWKKIKTGQ